jgi:hypothetical protein
MTSINVSASRDTHNSIQPVQQFPYTVGKNATDSAMIIDAMDLLYTKRFDGFCLVSSDSDFTRLASRIREEGLLVYGFGEKKTPKAFVSACDKFIFTEVFRFQEHVGSAAKPKTASELKRDTKLVSLLRSALEAASDDSGWAHLGAVGSKSPSRLPSSTLETMASASSVNSPLPPNSSMSKKGFTVTGIPERSTFATSARNQSNKGSF